MAIYVYCPYCGRRQTVNHAVCKGKRPNGEPCARRIPKTALRYFLEISKNGKHASKSLGIVRYAYACEQHRELERSINEGTYGQVVLTWGGIVSAYLRKLEAEKTNDQYQKDTRRYLNRMSDFWGGDLSSSNITPELIRKFRVSLLETKKRYSKEKNLSKSSVDRHLSAGKAAWNHSCSDVNPFSRVQQFRPKNEITRFLTAEQRLRLLIEARKISEDLFGILVVALATGMRKNNVLKLRRDQLDIERGQITVIQKGGTPHSILISKTLVEFLKAIPENGTPFFWVSNRGTPYHVDWRRPWRKVKALAGIPQEFRFHDLRHDAGTNVLATTGSLKAAKELLGHSDLRTTERYAHLLDDAKRAVTEAIDPLRLLTDSMTDSGSVT